MNQLDLNTQKFYEEMGFSKKEEKKSLNICCESAIQKYKLAHQNIEFWKQQLEEAREDIIEASQGKDAIFNGLCVTHYQEKGRVDYAAIKELENIDLDSYRKSPIMKTRISIM